MRRISFCITIPVDFPPAEIAEFAESDASQPASKTKHLNGVTGEQVWQRVLDDMTSKAGERLVQQRTHEKSIDVFVGDD